MSSTAGKRTVLCGRKVLEETIQMEETPKKDDNDDSSSPCSSPAMNGSALMRAEDPPNPDGQEGNKKDEMNNGAPANNGAGGAGGAPKDKEEEEEPVTPPHRAATGAHKQDFKIGTVYLYQQRRTSILPSFSAACLRIETFLRLTGIPFENVDHKMAFKSKKGQLPFVELNGVEISEPEVIISKLCHYFGQDPDAHLTKEEKNIAHAKISMIENHLEMFNVCWRANNPGLMRRGYKIDMGHALGTRLPIPNLILKVLFKREFTDKDREMVKARGWDVHSPAEVMELARKDIKVLEETLGNKQFFFGPQPSNLDIVAFAHLSQIVNVDGPVEYEMREWVKEYCPRLMGMLRRLQGRCYPDWERMTATLELNTHLTQPEAEPEDTKKEEEGEGQAEDKEGEGQGEPSAATNKEAAKETEPEKKGQEEDDKKEEVN